MAISYVGGQTASITASTATNTTINFALTGGLASTPAADDIVIVAYSIGSTVARTPAINTAGYTQQTALNAADSFDANLRVGHKVMGGTPDTSVQVGPTGNTADSGFVTIHVFRGVDTTTPLDGVTPTTATAANSGTPNPAAITPATSNNVIYVVGANGHGTTGTMTASYTTAFLTGQNIATTNRTTMGAGYVTGQSAGVSYDPAAFTWSANVNTQGWCAYTLVLRDQVTFQDGAALISPAATVTAAGQIVKPGAATASASATVVAAGDVVTGLTTGYGWSLYGVRSYGIDISYVDGAATISPAATTTVAGQRIAEGSAAVSPASTAVAAGQRIAQGAALVQPAATVTVAGQRLAQGAATATPAATTVVAGQRIAQGAATASPAASVTAAGQTIIAGSATITPAAAVTVAGQRIAEGAATIAPAATVVVAGQRLALGAATAAAAASVSVSGERVAIGAAIVSPFVTITVDASVVQPGVVLGSATISATAIVTASVPIFYRDGSATALAQLLTTASGLLFWDEGIPQAEVWTQQAEQGEAWAAQVAQSEIWSPQAANSENWADTTAGSTTWAQAV